MSLWKNVLLFLPSLLLAYEPLPIPFTEEEVTSYVQKVEENFTQTIHQILSIPDEQRTYENTLKPWNTLGREVLDEFSTLICLTQVNTPVQSAAVHAVQTLKGFFIETLREKPSLFYSLMTAAGLAITQNHPLSPFERYNVDLFLDSCISPHLGLSKETLLSIKHLKLALSQQSQTPYFYLKGNLPEKQSSDLNVLSLNTCLLPAPQSLIGGGIANWEQRLPALVEKILATHADVLCFQEVFSEEAALALYEHLKDHYAHFYLAIGPRPTGLSLETLGLPSGLFVASKYATENPRFTPFRAAASQMTWGFFDFVVKNQTQTLAHLYTTHMQSLDEPGNDNVRFLQLRQLVKQMQTDKQNSTLPFFLCGDLNIPQGINEPAEALIKNHFADDFQGRNNTYTYYFINYFFSPTKDPTQIDPKFQVLDYALLLEPSSAKIKTRLVPTNDLEHPNEALSDHHGLLTTILTR